MVEKPSVPTPLPANTLLPFITVSNVDISSELANLGVTHAWPGFSFSLQVVFRALPVSNVPKLTIMSLRAVLTFGGVLRYGGYLRLLASLADYLSAQRLCAPM